MRVAYAAFYPTPHPKVIMGKSRCHDRSKDPVKTRARANESVLATVDNF